LPGHDATDDVGDGRVEKEREPESRLESALLFVYFIGRKESLAGGNHPI
jgi:hypothetical protein